jgi:coenzyme F420 biosynthesis associated uncharacterized protein
MTDDPKLVDWEFAGTMARRLAGDGPPIGATDARYVVEELRRDAERSTGLVADYTGLIAPAGTAPILVVDRPGWIKANVDSFQTALEPIMRKAGAKLKDKPPGKLAQTIGSTVTGAEVGGALGFMATKVLGQFDPFHDPHGRLLLVAPNIVQVERELEVDPGDFRLWVCLHEETHRVQFTANPWMRDHLFALMTSLTESVDPGSSLNSETLKRVAEAIRGKGNLMEALSSPEQREIIDRVTGLMSLLEGHADVVMDGVGPSVIPSVADIRRKFTQRRKGVGTLETIIRRLMGMDAKMAQYRDGAAFVNHVVDKVGMRDFNTIFTAPETLPSKAEIHDPDSWVSRVL